MRIGRLWTLSALGGTLGAVALYDALPGINWTAWTVVAAAGLLIYRRPDTASLRALAIPLGFAVLLSGGAAVTTTPIPLLTIVLIVSSLLGLALVIARDHEHARNYGAVGIITAPVRAFAHTVAGAGSAVLATIESAETSRPHPVLRGSLIAAPVVVALALLFAAADPIFASGRDAVYDVLRTWGGAPRLIFGVMVALFIGGAYTASLPVASASMPLQVTPSPERIGLTERRIVVGAAAGISWLFVLLQISYLFRTTPGSAGSGMTFAEYARRGFGELALAATGSALLIVAVHAQTSSGPSSRASSRGERVGREPLAMPVLALLAAVACILVSAFHRVSLYEDAYGFTVTRVYAQAYMILTLVALVALAWRVFHAFDVCALAREVMTIALVTLTVLVYWNGDAWVARANLDRFAHTGKLDVGYLTSGLSPDAYPTLIQALPRMAAPDRAQLVVALAHEYARRPSLRAGSRWYEWNSRREQAKDALLALGVPRQ